MIVRKGKYAKLALSSYHYTKSRLASGLASCFGMSLGEWSGPQTHSHEVWLIRKDNIVKILNTTTNISLKLQHVSPRGWRGVKNA